MIASRLSMLAFLGSMPQRALIALVRGYRLLLSPWLGGACRFEPSCSSYSLQALQSHGAAAGSYLTLRRLVRCQPFCAGGHDPVPIDPPVLFRRLANPALRGADGFSSTSIDKTSP